MYEHTRTAQRIGLVAITNVLVAVSLIVMLPILTKRLPVADYGTWSLLTVTLNLIPALVTLGLPAAMIRFLAAARDKRNVRETFYSMAAVVVLTSAVVSGLFGLFAGQIASDLFYGNLTTAIIFSLDIFFACLNYLLLQYFRTFQQMKRYSVFVFLQAYLNVVLIAYFVFSGYGLSGAVTALLAQELVLFCIMLYGVIVQIGVSIPRFTHTREHLAFGLPLVPGNLSSWAVNSSDKYLIGLFLGTAAVGYYSPGYGLGSTIGYLYQPLTVLLPSVLSKYYDEDNVENVRTIMSYSLKYYVAIAVPSLFALSVLSKSLLLLLSTSDIAANGYMITPLVAAGTAFLGGYEVLVITLGLRKKTAIAGTIWIVCAALNIALNLVLIPYLGIVGAALTTLLAFMLAFAFTAIYSLRHIHFEINAGFFAKSVCASLIMALALFFINPVGLVNILLALALGAGIYLCVILTLRGLTVHEIKRLYRTFMSA